MRHVEEEVGKEEVQEEEVVEKLGLEGTTS